MNRLRPGELKILKSLSKDEKSYTRLRQETELQFNILSKYLKELQKSGLVSRDVDTRVYRMVVPSGWEMLYLTDILKTLEEAIGNAARKGLEEASICWWQLAVVVSEEHQVTKLVKEFLMSGSSEASEARLAISRMQNLVDKIRMRQILQVFGGEERKAIEAYQEKLSEAAWMLEAPSEEELENTRERKREEAECDLKRRYPGIHIMKEMVEIEAERRIEDLRKRRGRILSAVYGGLENLKEAVSALDEVPDKLKEIMEYLENPQNIEIYEKYLEKIKAAPKTLLIFPSSAFRGYLKKYWELFPEKKEAFKASHPWLHRQIVASFNHNETEGKNP